jgi:replication factor A1
MWKRIRKRRGKPRTGRPKYKDKRILAYLAKIAVKNKVNSHEFFHAILEAWHHKECQCKSLTIWCRKKMQESAIFLFTVGNRVIGQFPIPITILKGKNQLGEYMSSIAAKVSAKEREVVNPKIEDLKVGMNNINLRTTVVEIPKPVMVYSRWGAEAYVSNVLVADNTGSIRLSLWNQQIFTVSQGDEIQIEKGRVRSYRGEPQLRLGRQGSFSVVE